MATPAKHAWELRVRLGKFLRNGPRYIIRYQSQRGMYAVDTFVDSDWAGCVKTRRSTSGGMCSLGDHDVKSWAAKQNASALSNGEAEFYSVVTGMTTAMGVQAVLTDFGAKMHIRVFTDATAAKSLCSRKGLGKVRHIATSERWVREKIHQETVECTKLKGTSTTADMLTKHLPQQDLLRCVEILGHRHEKGRGRNAQEIDMRDTNAMAPLLMYVTCIKRCTLSKTLAYYFTAQLPYPPATDGVGLRHGLGSSGPTGHVLTLPLSLGNSTSAIGISLLRCNPRGEVCRPGESDGHPKGFSTPASVPFVKAVQKSGENNEGTTY